MRKGPSSSQKRKPLLLASLAASLTLHAGAVYFLLSHPFSFLSASSTTKNNQTLVQAIQPEFEVDFALKETLDRLILREESVATSSVDHPQFELAKPKLKILSNFTYAPKVTSSTKPLPFQLENPCHTITENEEYARLNPTLVDPKKWITFNQPLEVELSSLLAAEKIQEKATLKRQPKLEQESQVAKTQDNGKLPSIEAKKQKATKSKKIEKSPPLSLLASDPQKLKKNSPTSFDPSREQTPKREFDRESFYFFHDEKLTSSPLSQLDTSQTFSAPLFEKPYSYPKKTLQTFTKPSFAFFQTIAPLDLTPLAEAPFDFAPLPYTEGVASLKMPQNQQPSKVKQGEFSHSQLGFEPAEVVPPTQLTQRPFKSPTIQLEKTIGETFPSKLPEVPEERLASLSQKRNVRPQKELAELLELPNSSTFHRNQQILIFQTSLPFEFSVESTTLATPFSAPPKQPLTALSSKITLPELGFSTEVQVEKTLATQVTPKKESIDHSPSTPSTSTLPDLKLPSFVSTFAIALTPDASFAPDYLKKQIDFPQASLTFKSSDFSSIDMPEFSQTFDQHIAAKKVEPKQENVNPLEYASSMALDLAGIETKEKRLYTPEEIDDLSLSPSHTVRPKQNLSKRSSSLAQMSKPTLTEPTDLNNKALAKAVEPQEESIAISLDKTPSKQLESPSLPQHLLKRQSRVSLNLSSTPFEAFSPIAKAPPLTSFPKATPSLSPGNIEKYIELHLSEFEQTLAQKETAEPKQELATASLPKREDISLHFSKTAPSKTPKLDLEGGQLYMRRDELTLVKKELQAEESVSMPMLPNLKDKRVASSKVPFKPTKAFTELPSPDAFLALVPRTEAFPNTKRLLSKNPIPHREPQKDIQTTYTLNRNLNAPETHDIQSEAKQLIEKHYNESLAQNDSLNMAKPEIKKPLTEQDYHTLNETHRFTQGYLSEIPATASLDTISFQNDFETSVTYVKKPDGNGYHFALKIKPNEKLYFGSPEQNFIFIVDGSGTIKKHRYNTFKDAVVKSLSYMQDGDSFNILVADSQIAAMSDKPMTWSKQGIRNVRSYLQSRTYRGYFSNYDAFELLSKASQYLDPNKENVVILITDGHSLETITKHKEELKALAGKNKGNFSLFTASASQGNNIAMLDLISTFNNGEFMYSQTNAAFPRKLAVLVKHIESLIAKDIRVHVTSADSKLDVQFYPNQESYPSLYADQPYTLYGSIDKLEDFELILQGRSGENWINIKQKVSFHTAEEAGQKLKRNFALQQAYACYDYYLKQNDPFFLAEAERLLSPHSVSPATR